MTWFTKISPRFMLFFCFVVFSLFARLIFLRTTPTYFSDDEIHYITEAQAIAISGKNLKADSRPWYFRPTNGLYAELPSTVMALGAGVSDDPFMKARLVPVFMGLLLPLILGGIAWQLTHQKTIFYTTSVIGLLNPWLFQFSRLSFDPLVSLFFYSLGILMMLSLPKNWRVLSILAFILGFFQYQGLKLIFLPMLFLVVGYIVRRDWQWKNYKDAVKHSRKVFLKYADIGLVVLLGCVLFVWYLISLSSQNASSRVNDILFFNETYLSQKVNEQRRLSLVSPLQPLFVNKATVIAQEFTIKYLETFSPTHLFIFGESVRNPFSVWSRGIFHPLDSVLCIAGIVALIRLRRWRSVAVLLFGCVLISPLPVALNTIETWIMFRGSWLVVSGVMVMGIGAWYLMTQLPKVLFAVFALVYLGTVVSFGYEYFVRYPIYSAKGSAFAERVISNYIHRLSPDQKVSVLADSSVLVFEKYLAYNNLITRENLPTIGDALRNEDYRLGSVEFVTRCLDTQLLKDGSIVINNAVNVTCDKSPTDNIASSSVSITSLIDSGAVYRVYNDTLCSKYALPSYSYVTDRKMLDVEKLSDEEFCVNLFSK